MQSRLVVLHQGEVSQRHYWSWGASLQPHLTMGDCRAQLMVTPDGIAQPSTLPNQAAHLLVPLELIAQPVEPLKHGAQPIASSLTSEHSELMQ